MPREPDCDPTSIRLWMAAIRLSPADPEIGLRLSVSGKRVDRPYLPMQNELKIRPNRSSELKAPVISLKYSCTSRSSSATNSPAA